MAKIEGGVALTPSELARAKNELKDLGMQGHKALRHNQEVIVVNGDAAVTGTTRPEIMKLMQKLNINFRCAAYNRHSKFPGYYFDV